MNLKGKEVRLLKDSSGDLPKSLIGKKAIILKRNYLHDEMGIKAYTVKFNHHAQKQIVLWEDEFKII